MEVFLKRLRVIQKCCCCSLKVGTLFILWIWVCFALLAMFGVLIAWINVSSDMDRELRRKFYDKGKSERDSSPYSYSYYPMYVDTSDLYYYVNYKITFLCLLCYISLFQLIPHILALYSIRKKIPSYLEPYLHVKITEFLFGAASVITLCLSIPVAIANDPNIVGAMLGSGIIPLIYVVINYYCTSVVYSYYVMMKEEKKNDQIAAELIAILPAGNSLLQNPSVSSPINNQPSVNEMSSLPIKNFQNNIVGPSFVAMENQPFMQHKDSNLKCN